MKLFNKLANILFDEDVEEEIPVITKEEVKEEKKENVEKKNDDDIIVTKIESKKEEVTKEMPRVGDSETHTKKFTFPFIDDDDDEEIPKRSEGKTVEDYSYAVRTEEIPVVKHHEEKTREER